jgi:ribokinase
VCLLNPAPVARVVVELLNRGPIVTPNGSELHDLVTLLGSDPGTSAEDAASRIAMVSHQPVVVTQGAEGVLLVTADSVVHVPAPSVSVRDTTGAGDTFNGVLAARLAVGDDLGAAVPYAVAAAALSVTEVGARGGMPTAAAIEAALTI